MQSVSVARRTLFEEEAVCIAVPFGAGNTAFARHLRFVIFVFAWHVAKSPQSVITAIVAPAAPELTKVWTG